MSIRREGYGDTLTGQRLMGSRKTLLMLPSMLVRLSDGSPVAWAFMGKLGFAGITLLEIDPSLSHRP